MSDQGFHEIQLSGKQLVFLFMSLLVLAVVVFLLGVSVGRGVRLAVPSVPPPAVDAAAGDVAAPAVMPPPTQTSPNELDYHERLQGRGASGAAEPPKVAELPPPPAEAPPLAAGSPTTGGSKTAAPARGGADASKTAAAPPTTTSAAKPAPGPQAPAPSAGAWSVQVEAFRSKDLADTLVSKLKAKGYAAFIFNSTTPGVPYHVRIGPFAQRDDAVRTADRLKKEGFGPSVIR